MTPSHLVCTGSTLLVRADTAKSSKNPEFLRQKVRASLSACLLNVLTGQIPFPSDSDILDGRHLKVSTLQFRWKL